MLITKSNKITKYVWKEMHIKESMNECVVYQKSSLFNKYS